MLQELYKKYITPALAGLIVGGETAVKITMAALDSVFIPIVVMAKLFVYIAQKVTGKEQPEMEKNVRTLVDLL